MEDAQRVLFSFRFWCVCPRIGIKQVISGKNGISVFFGMTFEAVVLFEDVLKTFFLNLDLHKILQTKTEKGDEKRWQLAH